MKRVCKNFANNIGFENMESVWVEVHENVAYINLAPVENGVIMYPDIVKVKVDLTSQEIIGFEAVNYAFNHVERNFEFIISYLNAESIENVRTSSLNASIFILPNQSSTVERGMLSRKLFLTSSQMSIRPSRYAIIAGSFRIFTLSLFKYI